MFNPKLGADCTLYYQTIRPTGTCKHLSVGSSSTAPMLGVWLLAKKRKIAVGHRGVRTFYLKKLCKFGAVWDILRLNNKIKLKNLEIWTQIQLLYPQIRVLAELSQAWKCPGRSLPHHPTLTDVYFLGIDAHVLIADHNTCLLLKDFSTNNPRLGRLL